MENTTYEPRIWYGWNGGECPVHPETIVAIRLRDRNKEHSQCDSDMASRWLWKHYAPPSSYDIVAFTIITPHVEPRKPREIWVNDYPTGMDRYNYSSEESANEDATLDCIRCVKFVEVIEE